MFKVNLTDVKTHLSRYLNSVEKGETVIVCRRNVPIAEIRPVPKPRVELRPVGIDRGMVIPAEFFDPIPDDLLDAFEGKNGPVSFVRTEQLNEAQQDAKRCLRFLTQ